MGRKHPDVKYPYIDSIRLLLYKNKSYVQRYSCRFKEFRIWFLNWLFYRRHAIKMSLAIKLADIKQRAFNKQFHVMLTELS